MFLTKASYNTEQHLELLWKVIYLPRENIRYFLEYGKCIQCLMEYNGLKRELADIALLNKQKSNSSRGARKSKQTQRIFAVKTITDFL